MAKGPEAFRTISEAADELGVPQHVLRFWETRFSFIRPMKRAGGRRFYRPQDIIVLRGVQHLLHDDGYTIKGVQRLHREEGIRRVIAAADGSVAAGLAAAAEDQDADFALPPAPPVGDQRLALLEALGVLEAAKAEIDQLLDGR
ncbi:MAG TPA: MerR family transcriptional regulator [Caulobacteraceae bacterium]